MTREGRWRLAPCGPCAFAALDRREQDRTEGCIQVRLTKNLQGPRASRSRRPSPGEWHAPAATLKVCRVHLAGCAGDALRSRSLKPALSFVSERPNARPFFEPACPYRIGSTTRTPAPHGAVGLGTVPGMAQAGRSGPHRQPASPWPCPRGARPNSPPIPLLFATRCSWPGAQGSPSLHGEAIIGPRESPGAALEGC